MIIVLKKNADAKKVNELENNLKDMGFALHISDGESSKIVGLVGDTTKLSQDDLLANEIIEDVKRIQEPYKKANRKMHPEDTVVDVNGIKIGGGHFQVIAGPCSVESKEQMEEVASDVKASGATLLRGGAFKPRTSPYSFQGLHENGLALLLNAGKTTNLPVVTELLKKLGKLDKPILLKRGLANTLEELLMSAEYIMAGGNEKVILCERGIRTFETSMRNTLDISAVPMLKKMTHLPVIIDPSHAAGMRWMVEPLSMAAIAAGADGLMIEVHNNPEKALCDGKQSLTPESFDNLMGKIKKTVEFFGKTLD